MVTRIFLRFFIWMKWFTITEKPSPWWFEGVGIWFKVLSIVSETSWSHGTKIDLIFKINTFQEFSSPKLLERFWMRAGLWDSLILGEYYCITCFFNQTSNHGGVFSPFLSDTLLVAVFFCKNIKWWSSELLIIIRWVFFFSIRRKNHWKLTMSPENHWLEDVLPTEIVPFFGKHVSFRGRRYCDWLTIWRFFPQDLPKSGGAALMSRKMCYLSWLKFTKGATHAR